jgi:hypothetical protein
MHFGFSILDLGLKAIDRISRSWPSADPDPFWIFDFRFWIEANSLSHSLALIAAELPLATWGGT